LVGGLALSFERPQSFSTADRSWLAGFAAQAALAAERARLYEAEKRARAEAEALFRINESLNAARLDLETLAQRVTDEATALVGAGFGAFFYDVVNEQGESYLLYTVSGAPREAFTRFGLPRNTPIFAPTFAGEGVVRLADVKQDPRYGSMAPHHGIPPGHPPVTSYLAVPVISRTGAVLGGLFFGHPEPDRFSEQHERMVKAVAASAAAAIDNARLFRATVDAEETQRRLVAELSETVRLNDLFTGVLAHDLRNPLGAILSSAEVASRTPAAARDEAQLAKVFSRIAGSGRRMSRMIEQLLDFTRIRFGTSMRLEPRLLDLRELVRRVTDELAESHPGVRLTLTAAGDTTGSWDEDRLCQVLSNLVGNAVQHGVREHGVEMALDGSAPSSIVLTVHNGGSIPSERLRRLFAPFEDNASRKHGGSGLGLGLFIAHELARAHGGSLEAQSSPETGTTFTLTLPRRAALRAPPSRPGALSAAPDDDDFDAWQRSMTLGETGEKFRLLVESVKDYAIFMLDTHGRVATWNAGAERIKGYQAREIIGQHFSTFYGRDDVTSGLCERELAIAASEGRLETEGLRVRKDGTTFWANVVITALYDERGTLTGFAKVTHDLTERRRLEEERLRRAQAEEAVRVRDEFLSVASHELRTPLAVVELQLDALEAQLSSREPSLARTLSRARRGTSQLTRLVDSLLEATRIATDSFTLFRETFELSRALGACLDTLRKPAELAGCELTTSLEGPLVGNWDRRRLEQLVTNLVWNAFTYAPGAPVHVGATCDGGAVVIEVSDHGPGIAKADAERIFDRFERACATSEFSGLGLGLYVVREIANAHGGSVSVDTAPGRGARFMVRLPTGTTAA